MSCLTTLLTKAPLRTVYVPDISVYLKPVHIAVLKTHSTLQHISEAVQPAGEFQAVHQNVAE